MEPKTAIHAHSNECSNSSSIRNNICKTLSSAAATAITTETTPVSTPPSRPVTTVSTPTPAPTVTTSVTTTASQLSTEEELTAAEEFRGEKFRKGSGGAPIMLSVCNNTRRRHSWMSGLVVCFVFRVAYAYGQSSMSNVQRSSSGRQLDILSAKTA